MKTRLSRQKFLDNCSYISGQYDTDDGYIELNKHIRKLEDSMGVANRDRLFYLALPPSVFAVVSAHLRRNVYPNDEGTVRVIIEKPFGHDLESSQELQMQLEPIWEESEIFRIDHYLGKEMVKNILILRFGNLFFSSSWNNRTISNVQISFKEPFGTQGRGGYFDSIGIIRDSDAEPFASGVIAYCHGATCFIWCRRYSWWKGQVAQGYWAANAWRRRAWPVRQVRGR